MKYKIDITNTNGTFTYPIDMSLVQVEQYAWDNSFCIAEGSGLDLPVATQEDYLLLMSPQERALVEIKAVEDAIDATIQNEIDAYNASSGVFFKDINALQKYTIDETYTHYAFCVSMLAWNIEFYDSARQLQIDIANGVVDKPASVEDFVALLPKRV